MATIEKFWKEGPDSSVGGGISSVKRLPSIARASRNEAISEVAANSLKRCIMLGERSIAWIDVTYGPKARDMVPVPQA